VIEVRGEGRLSVSGSLALDTVESFDAAVEPYLAPGAVVSLDIAGLAYLDSSGIRALVQARGRLLPEGRLILLAPSSRIMKKLRLAGLSQAPGFEVVVDLRSAVEGLSDEARERLMRAIASHPVARTRLARRLPDASDDPSSAPLDELIAVVEDDEEIRATIHSLLGTPQP
jgi:anti-anti-sigma factor